MKTIIYSTLLILLALTLSTCDKNECQNCYPTVFECKVDGKTWKTSCESKDFFGCTALDVQLYPNTNSLEIYAKNEENNSALTLFIVKTLKLGSNKLYSGPNDIFTKYVNASQSITCRIYKIDTTSSNFFKITKLDSINQVLKASFEFTGKNDCGDEVKITNGKLDVIYRN